ncbi:MAG: SDR family oxidoreductase [Nitrospirae bacterium]|nr:MAG: SDR family oxidoreductase [Nitrospirota bacterium]
MSVGAGAMRVLITGGTGLVGGALIATAGSGYRLTILHQRDYPVQADGVEAFIVDVRNREQLSDLFGRGEFDAVIHAAGIASVDYVEHHVEEGWESNVAGTQNVVDLVLKKDIKFVYLSSNAVFDGRQAPYREGDSTNPVNQYGRIKVECEKLVMRLCPEAAIVRPILMYGWQPPHARANPATWLIDRLRRGQPTHLVTDVYENPLWAGQCAAAIWRVIQMGKTGIFHIAGQDIVSRYEFAQLVAGVFGMDSTLLHPVDSGFFPAIAPRPKNTSFLTERMQADLGLDPLPLREGLERMRALGSPLTLSSHT